MAITITNGALSVSVREIIGWSTSRLSSNIIHEVIGRGDHDVSLGDLRPRSGSFMALVNSLGEAVGVEDYFATKGIHVLADTERPEVNMRFVINGAVDVTLDGETATAATVTIGFQQVIV